MILPMRAKRRRGWCVDTAEHDQQQSGNAHDKAIGDAVRHLAADVSTAHLGNVQLDNEHARTAERQTDEDRFQAIEQRLEAIEALLSRLQARQVGG